MNIAKINNNSGMSLLEVMISMIVIAVGLMGLAPMIGVSIDGNSISRDCNTVSDLAKEKIEYYQGLPSDSIPAVPFTESEQINSQEIGNSNPDISSLQGFNYSRVTTITDNSVDSSVPEDLYEIKIDILWTDAKNIARQTTYSTFLIK